jgi:hypothetical protein
MLKKLAPRMVGPAPKVIQNQNSAAPTARRPPSHCGRDASWLNAVSGPSEFLNEFNE